MSTALERALERGNMAIGKNGHAVWQRAPVDSSPGGGASALLSSVAGENNILAEAGRTRTMSHAAEQYRHNTNWVFAVVRAIAQRWAGQPLRVARSVSRGQRVKPSLRPSKDFLPRHLKGQQERLELLDDHPILDIMERPNALMVRWSLTFVTAASLELTGRCYWWIYEGKAKGDEPWTIMPLPSSWVEPKHGDGRLNNSWLIRPGNMTTAIEVPGEEIAYIHYPDPSNPLGALSPLQAIARAVVANEAISEAQRRSFSNGIWAGYAITVGKNPDVNGQPGSRPTLTSAQRGQILNTILQAYRGVINYDQPIILDGLIESISKISNSPREMDFIKSHAMTKEQISQAFGVSPIIIGQIEGSNRASSAAAEDHFTSSTLNPKLELVSQILTAVVAPRFADDGERLVLYYEPAHAYDPDLELARWKTLLANGGCLINEVRQSLGLAPLPGGDIALLGQGLTPYNLKEAYDWDADVPAAPAGGGAGKPPGGGGGTDSVDNLDKAYLPSRRMGEYTSGN